MPVDASYKLISADSHVNPRTEMWAEYLAPEFKDRAPRVESTEEADFEVFEGKRKPIANLSSVGGRRPEEYTPTIRRFDEVRPGGWEPAARLEDQDIDGVAAEVLFGAVGNAPLASEDRRLARASFTAYNHWLADFCAYNPDRLIGLAGIPCDDPADAIAEVEDAAARGLRGAVIPHVPGSGEWQDDDWEPFWRSILDKGWPVHLHVSAGVRRSLGTVGGDAQQAMASGGTPRGDLFMNSLVASKLETPLSLGRFVLGGTLERYPDVRLVSVEAQIGWVPFWKYYIDHLYDKHRWWTHFALKERPSVYVDRQIWFTFMEDPPGIELAHRCNVNRIMWSSDYPHSETTYPHSRKIAEDILSQLPPEQFRRVVRDNCAELYDLTGSEDEWP
jgi:predicted TIM-barrel fold metal-dependent hydrolase